MSLFKRHEPARQDNFNGHTFRECGDHRSAGSLRAWCIECVEWCYVDPDMSCRGCKAPPPIDTSYGDALRCLESIMSRPWGRTERDRAKCRRDALKLYAWITA